MLHHTSARFATFCVLLLPALARSDGGTIRLAQRCGDYQITVFTSPASVRAGPVDISVLVQEVSTGEPASGARVTITIALRGTSTVITHDAKTHKSSSILSPHKRCRNG